MAFSSLPFSFPQVKSSHWVCYLNALLITLMFLGQTKQPLNYQLALLLPRPAGRSGCVADDPLLVQSHLIRLPSPGQAPRPQ